MHTQGMGVDLCFQISPNKRNWKKMFMQTQSVGVDLHSKISLDKRDWKKTFIQPPSMGVDLPIFISLDKQVKKISKPVNVCRSTHSNKP